MDGDADADDEILFSYLNPQQMKVFHALHFILYFVKFSKNVFISLAKGKFLSGFSSRC